MKATNAWSIFSVVILFTFHDQFGLFAVNGLSISPPSEEIFSNQLCPDPTTKTSTPTPDSSSSALSTWNSWWPSSRSGAPPPSPSLPPKILAINLDKPKDSTHFYESCTFKEQWEPGYTGKSPRPKQNVRVRSINLNVNSWNFSTAQNCSTFIKFNNWDDHDGGRYPVLCGRENFDQYLGPYGHPMVLYYQWKKGGLSFPLFHSNYGEHHRDRKETLELQYMQIYFFVTPGSKDAIRRCRVQQYRLDWLRMGCSSVVNEEYQVCGEYPCQELEALYQSKMTIFKDGESENDTVLVWKSKTDKYRMRTFLRQKFVPVVFLVVLICAYRSYMKAGLRYQNSIQDDHIPELRVRSIRRRIPTSRAYPGRGPGPWRDVTTDATYWNFTEDHDPPPQYVPPRLSSSDAVPQIQNATNNQSVAVTLPKQNENEVEPPPPYESVCPPTYKEATKP